MKKAMPRSRASWGWHARCNVWLMRPHANGLSGTQELGMAARLLEATDASALESVLAALLLHAAARAGLDADPDTTRALRAGLRRAATRLGFPRLASPDARVRAARMLGIELEGLSPEDKELEIARRFVRLGADAVRRLRHAGDRGASAAQRALLRAQRRLAPGLVAAPRSHGACKSDCACSGCAGASHDLPNTSDRSSAMHDIDQTKAEYDSELDEMELDELDELDEMGGSDEMDSGELSDSETDSGEFETGQDEYGADETGSPFSEVEEAELAQELLGLSGDGELDQFLGKIFKKAWRGVSGLRNQFGSLARPLGGILKGVAKKMLPVAAGAAGTFFGGPAGAAIGSKIGSFVGNSLEMEFEGSAEDREFEAAKTFVRMAGTAARQAANSSPGASPVSTAKRAILDASRSSVRRLRARRRGTSGYGGYATGRRSGRWVRRGNRIILFGI